MENTVIIIIVASVAVITFLFFEHVYTHEKRDKDYKSSFKKRKSKK